MIWFIMNLPHCPRRLVALCFLVCISVVCVAQPLSYILPTLDGETFSTEELSSGRYILAFVVVPGCSACTQVIPWLEHVADAFPEVCTLLVAPEATSELEREADGGIRVVLDQDGKLGGAFQVEQAPKIFFIVEGVSVHQLEWPFSEGNLLRATAESLLIDVRSPDPRELLGEQAPSIEAVGLDTEKLAVDGLPRPLLLVFLRVGCSTCWDVLSSLEGLSEEVPVGLVVIVSAEGEVSESDQRRLEQLEHETAGSPISVLITHGMAVLEDYRLATSPTFCLVDEQGLVAEVWESHLDRTILEERLRALSSNAEAN